MKRGFFFSMYHCLSVVLFFIVVHKKIRIDFEDFFIQTTHAYMRFAMFSSYQYNHECLVQLVMISDLSGFFNRILSYYLSFLMKDDHVIFTSMHPTY